MFLASLLLNCISDCDQVESLYLSGVVYWHSGKMTFFNRFLYGSNVRSLKAWSDFLSLQESYMG